MMIDYVEVWAGERETEESIAALFEHSTTSGEGETR